MADPPLRATASHVLIWTRPKSWLLHFPSICLLLARVPGSLPLTEEGNQDGVPGSWPSPGLTGQAAAEAGERGRGRGRAGAAASRAGRSLASTTVQSGSELGL